MTPVEQARQERLKQSKSGGSVPRVSPVEQARQERAKAQAKEGGKPKLSPIEQAKQERQKLRDKEQAANPQVQAPRQKDGPGLGKMLFEELVAKPAQIFPHAIAQKICLEP